VYYLHGGGYIALTVPLYRKKIKDLVSRSGVQIFAPDYRVAPESPYPIPIEDVWAGLQHLSQNAGSFGVDPARIAIMGDSGGGGLAAGLGLKARDEALNPPLAKQILVYPMLDDRNTKPIQALESFATWNYTDNTTGWQAYLSGKAGAQEIPYYAAAARAPSLQGLPPTYIDVGDLDIFRDEDLEYARRMAAANIHTELHLYPGVPHGFDLIAADIPVTLKALGNRINAIRSI
jgi:acetyl esterase/lipase